MRQIFDGRRCLSAVKPASVDGEGGLISERSQPSLIWSLRIPHHFCMCSVCSRLWSGGLQFHLKKAKIQVIRINPDISWKIHLFELLPVPFWPPDLWACLVKWTWVASPNNFSFLFLLTEISNALNKLSTLSVPLNQQTCFNWIDFALLLVKSGTVMLLRLLFLLVPAASASHTMCFWKAQRDPVQSTTLQYMIHFGWLTFAAIGKSHR